MKKLKKLKEMELFEGLLDNPRNELVEKAIQEGRIAIGYNCYMVPEPLLSMGNVFPVRLRAPGVGSMELATHYMSPFICSYARSILESMLDGSYDFLGGVIYAASCSHIMRCCQHFELLDINKDKAGFFTFLLDTPRKVSESNVELLTISLRKVAKKMAQQYGIETSDDALCAAIAGYNAFNRLMREISDLRKADNPRITGTEYHTLFVASKVAPRDMLIEPLKKLKAALLNREPIKDYRARVMVVGSIFDNPMFTGLIEEEGGLVVADRYCFGSLPGLEEIRVQGDPYEQLVRHYLGTCECPRMMEEAKKRIVSVRALMKEYRADGIIFETMKFCDLWGYEVLSVVNRLRDEGTPIVRIEREYAFTAEGQLRTRVQAFIELIETKRLTKVLAR